MKRLGTVKNLTRNGHVLLRVQQSVDVGKAVHDARGSYIGRITRVFGPVKEPYALVKPEGTGLTKLLDTHVYVDSLESRVDSFGSRDADISKSRNTGSRVSRKRRKKRG